MAERAMVGACEDCHKRFEYALIHNGVNNSSYAYCERCGTVAILDLADSRFPVESLKESAYHVIAPGVEAHLKPCTCGGKFSAQGAPHCPFCQQPLSPVKAAEYLERQAPKSAHDWHWQNNWKGNYCMVVEGKQVRNNFK